MTPLPVVLMPVRAVAEVVRPEASGVRHACDVVGRPSVALLAGCVPAVFTLGGRGSGVSRRLHHPAANGSGLRADLAARPRTSARRPPTAPAATRQPCATTPTGVVAWCMGPGQVWLVGQARSAQGHDGLVVVAVARAVCDQGPAEFVG
ncbi:MULTISPECIES: GntT/GntP/DsdX family permease [Streptomyces]|uniref:GntT/GntP/DsdX family permease n=1 Tax=Streptomyces TaxID=1883 RepID=UPI0035B4B40A